MTKRIFLLEKLTSLAALDIALKQTISRQKASIILLDAPEKGFLPTILKQIFKIQDIRVDPRGLADFLGADGANLGWHRDLLQANIAKYIFTNPNINRFRAILEKQCGQNHSYNIDDIIKIYLTHRISSDSRHDYYALLTLKHIAKTLGQNVHINILLRKNFFTQVYQEIHADKDISLFGPTFYRPSNLCLLLRKSKAIALLLLNSIYRSESANKFPKLAVQAPWILSTCKHVRGVDYLESRDLSLDKIVHFGDASGHFIKRHIEPWPEVKDPYRYNHRNYQNTLRPLAKEMTVSLFSYLRIMTAPSKSFEYYWLWARFNEFSHHYDMSFSFFDAHNIKAVLHYGDTNPSYVPQYIATENLGAINLCNQFSTTGSFLLAGCRPLPGHQYMLWGMAEWDKIKKADNVACPKAPNVGFITGHITHYLIDHKSIEAENCYKTLRSNCEQIVAVFDVNTRKDKDVSPLQAESFYTDVLDYALAHSHIGLFIKPQGNLNLGGEITDKVRLLENQGRIALIKHEFLSPFVILQYADFAVGLSSFNSALSEAAIAGIPHIYYDLPQFINHLNYEHAPPDFIAQNRKEFFEKLTRGLLLNKIATQDPVFKSYAEWIDPFQDKKGHHRVSQLCKLWIDEIDKRGDSSRAMPYVIDKYRRLYGTDKVIIHNSLPYKI